MVAKFQRLWRNYRKSKEVVALKNQTNLLLYKGGKERRRESFYRPFDGLYLPLTMLRKDVALKALLHQHEPPSGLQIIFADRVASITANQATPLSASPVIMAAMAAAAASAASSGSGAPAPPAAAAAQLLSAAVPLGQTGNNTAHWLRTELLFIITKENLYLIQETQQSNASSSNGSSSSGAPAASASPLPDRAKSPQQNGPPARAASPPPSFAHFLPPYFLRRVLPLASLASLSLTPFADTFLALHVAPEEMVRVRPSPPWATDDTVRHCGECGEGFGWFFRRHHCRLCGHIYCKACTARQLYIPDLSFLRDPVRCCSFCWGTATSADFAQDLLLASDRRTEIMVVLRQLRSFSPCPPLAVNFSPVIQLRLREHVSGAAAAAAMGASVASAASAASAPGGAGIVPVLVTREVCFARGKVPSTVTARAKAAARGAPSSSGCAGSGWDLVPVSPLRAEVKVAEGLAPDFIKAVQKRAAKRRAAAEERKVREAEERRRRAARREQQREQERRERVAEKKRAKHAARAHAEAAAAEEAAAAAASGAQQSRPGNGLRSRPVPSASAAAAGPAAPPCSTCGCTQFTANMFKKGTCNTCYHKHE
jgi:hypothetical protein